MTQAPAAAPAPPPPPNQAAAAIADAPTRTDLPSLTSSQRLSKVKDTPRLLNRLQLAGMALVIVFGLLNAMVQFMGWESDGRAAADAQQTIRAQDIQSTLLHADALATNAFLGGGLEETAERERYDDAIASVFSQIADAAESQPADRAALAALNVEVNDYANAIAQARSFHRLGYPVGAEYLSGASTALRADAIPILQNLVTANSERSEDSINGQHPLWLLLIGLAALVGLWFLNRVLAKSFHRRVNVGLSVAAGIVLVVTLVSSVLAWRAAESNDGLLKDELAIVADQSAARTAANDAKSNESLLLIKRGSGATYEPLWQEAAAIVEARADASTIEHWNTYAERHAELYDREAEDRHGAALALAEGEAGTSKPFDAFDKASRDLIEAKGAEAADALQAGRSFAFVLALASLLLGIVAAVAIARGIEARRKEFA